MLIPASPRSGAAAVVWLTALLFAPTLPAQETAPVVLRVAASPRAFGLGDAFVSGRGSEVVFYNPAQIGLTTGLFGAAARYGGASRISVVMRP